MRERIDIIGAGIGGLTSALVFQKRGFHINIYEGADAIKPVGAGILLASNAMQVFEKLGIRKKVEQAGQRVSTLKITDTRLRGLSITDLSPFEQKYGVCNVAIHRADLHQLLAQEVGHQHIQLSKRLTKIENANPFRLTFEDQTSTESGFLLGADGIKSMVRDQLFGKSTLRSAKQSCWRGSCEVDLPSKYDHELIEAWGRGKRIGFVKLNPRQIYWFALANSKTVSGDKVVLGDLFGEFHPDILKIISETPLERIVRTEIMDLEPLDSWQKDRVCLIGDAAHATTPNLGQGACQAIEDAYVIGQLLDRGFELNRVFENYEKIRREKASLVVNASWAIGKMAHWDNPVRIGIRNFLLRFTPSFIHRNQIEKIFQLNKC